MGTTSATVHEGPSEVLLAWLRDNAVEHEVHEHDETFTARETARAEGVDPHTFAKVIGVAIDDGAKVMVVLEATDRLDFRKAREALSAHDVRLLDEKELVELAPGFGPGAIPAVGALFGVPMVADHALREDPELSFNAGDHRHCVRVDRASWERSTRVRYADLAEDVDQGPVWAR
jgi:Ala-tRNA(Pro) deacylase